MPNPEYCPDCIEELKLIRKKMQRVTKWLQCPVCGYIKRPEHELEKGQRLDKFYEQKEIINNKLTKSEEV